MSIYAYMIEELLKIGFATIPMAEAAKLPGLAHTIDPKSIPGIQPPKRAMPKTNLAPPKPSVGAAKVPSVPKMPKVKGVFGKAMKGVSKVM